MLDLDQIKFRRQEWQLVGKRWILFGRPGRVHAGGSGIFLSFVCRLV